MLKILAFACLVAFGAIREIQDVPALLDMAEVHPSIFIKGINKINTPPQINSYPPGFEIIPDITRESGYLDPCGVFMPWAKVELGIARSWERETECRFIHRVHNFDFNPNLSAISWSLPEILYTDLDNPRVCVSPSCPQSFYNKYISAQLALGGIGGDFDGAFGGLGGGDGCQSGLSSLYQRASHQPNTEGGDGRLGQDGKEHEHGVKRHVFLGAQILIAALLFPFGVWVSKRGCEIADKSLNLSIEGRQFAGGLRVIGGVGLIFSAGVGLAIAVALIFDQRFLFGVLIYSWFNS